MEAYVALIIGYGIGLLFAFFDRKRGKFWYRAWYKLTNKDPLAEDSELTFLINQPFSARLVPAVLISLVAGFLFWVTGDLNILLILLYVALMFIGMMLSFYTFPFFVKRVQPQLGKIKETIEKIDSIEASIKTDDQPEPEKIEPEKPSDKKDEEGGDWRKGVQDFLDK